MVACNDSGEKAAATDTMVMDKPVEATGNENTTTVYAGTLPCADCEGIETTITLHTDHTFEQQSVYKTNRPGEKEFADSGTWMNHDGGIIHLKNKSSAGTMYIKTDSTLVQLDGDGKRIEGPVADKFILKKIN